MHIVLKIVLDLLIVGCALKLDETGYGAAFAAVALLRYELGPMLADKETE